MNTLNSSGLNFKANIKLTPYTKKLILNTPSENQLRFFNAQKKLNLMEVTDELLLSRKKNT